MKVDGIKNSKRMYAFILMIIAFFLSLKGIELTTELQTDIINWIDTVIIAVSGAIVLWSKIKQLFQAEKETKIPMKKLIIEGVDDEN